MSTNGLPRFCPALKRGSLGYFILTLGLLLGSFLLLAFMARASGPLPGDLPITLAVQRIEQPTFVALMEGVSLPGFAPLVHLIFILMVLFLWVIGRRLESLFVVAGGGAGLAASLVKVVVARPRPEEGLVRVLAPLKDYSFPSIHAVHYLVFYGFLFYLAYTLLQPSWKRTVLLVPLAALILLIGPSRVYEGQHWASDVLAGYLFGAAYLLVLAAAYRCIRRSLYGPGLAGRPGTAWQ